MDQLQLLIPEAGKDLRDTYPFLEDIEEFSKLSADELLFSYLYGCRSSDYFDIDDEREKITKCCEKSFGTNQRKIVQYQQKIPENVFSAIKRFGLFNEGIRSDAHMMFTDMMRMQKKILKRIEISLALDEVDDGGGVDLSEAGKAVDTMNKISEGLPKIVEKIEGGLGIRQRKTVTGTQQNDDIFSRVQQNQQGK